MRRFFGSRLGVFVIVALILAGLGWLVYLATQEHQRWTAWCIDMGGHVKTETSTYQTFTYVDGKSITPQTHVDYTYFCLSEQGGIIDIRG